MKTKRIAIVGGGTAGWLAANHLGCELSADPEVEITVIESDEIPIIGVGEGTVPAIKTSLRKFGISEVDLLMSCDTTFKNGIKFIDWLDPEKHGQGNFYYHPFASPYPSGLDVTPYWLENSEQRPFSEVSCSARVAQAMRSPKAIASPPYQGEVDYAYHVNARKFAELLSDNAKKRFRVKHLIATIKGAERGEDGTIRALRDKTGERFAFDFYIDCSGFSSLLTEGALAVPFIDKSKQILTDTALVQQVPISEDEEIPPYTQATAHSAGWIWDIPVTNRRGTGFVYSSAHMSDEAARLSFAAYLGVNAEALSPRKIAMKIGYRQDFWAHNCVALGLAQGFVEPLEATSILLTDFSANLFARNFPRYQSDTGTLRPYCNEVVAYTWERIIDFVQLHYLISDRVDSQFWLDNRHNPNQSEVLRDRLAKWKLGPPKKMDFFSRFDLFDVDNYLYVLYGMKYATRQMPISNFERKESLAEFDLMRQSSQGLIQALPSHREWLTGLRAALSQR